MQIAEQTRKVASPKPPPPPRPAQSRRGSVVASLEKHILVDGFKLIFDAERSRGSRFVDAATAAASMIDLYSFYASQPIGFNHPHFDRPEVQADLLRAAKIKVANADVYTPQYATFVETFARVVGLPPLRALLLHRRRRAGGRERAQGRDGLEGAQEPRRRSRRARHGDHPFRTRLPRSHRLHDEPDEHRPAQDRLLRQVPLAAHQHADARFLAAGGGAR